MSRQSLLTRLGRTVILSSGLLVTFLIELVSASLLQGRLVLRRRLELTPRWIQYDSSLRTAGLRVLLGMMISLTPGTVTADLRGSRLVLHVLNSESEEQILLEIQSRLELRLKKLEELWTS